MLERLASSPLEGEWARTPQEGKDATLLQWIENPGERAEEEDARRAARRSRDVSSNEEDEDDEGGPTTRPSKRAKQNKALFSWSADAFIRKSVLPERHQKILKIIENYKLDLDSAIDSIEQSGGNPIWPKKLWKPILRDEYIELSEVLAIVSAYHIPDTAQAVSNSFADALESTTLAKPTPSKAIVDENTWHRAWHTTKDTISFTFDG